MQAEELLMATLRFVTIQVDKKYCASSVWVIQKTRGHAKSRQLATYYIRTGQNSKVCSMETRKGEKFKVQKANCDRLEKMLSLTFKT